MRAKGLAGNLKSFGMAATTLSAAMLLASTAGAADLITNGGFETGDFTGWILGDTGYPEYIVTSPVESGTYAAQIAGFSYAVDTLTQDVTSNVGQSYTLSFGYFQDQDVPNGLTVTWDGATVFTQTPDTGTNGAYANVTATVVGQGADSLVFTAYNDPAYTYLDDVSVTSVPEPAAWALMLTGLTGLGASLRSRRKMALAVA